jgi:segregation and condensation protein B
MDEFARLTALVEALLLVTDRPLTLKELSEFLSDPGEDSVRAALSALASRYATTDSGLQVEELAGGVRLATRAEFGEEIKEFFRLKNRQKLSRAALETLAIVAYKQPVTHPEIQEIRGVSADGVLRTLLERRLVRIVGRKETVGRPLLYGTTRSFMEQFGLGSLDDLPPVEEFGELLGEGASESLGETLRSLPGGDGSVLQSEPASGPAGTDAASGNGGQTSTDPHADVPEDSAGDERA